MGRQPSDLVVGWSCPSAQCSCCINSNQTPRMGTGSHGRWPVPPCKPGLPVSPPKRAVSGLPLGAVDLAQEDLFLGKVEGQTSGDFVCFSADIDCIPWEKGREGSGADFSNACARKEP